MSEDLVDLLTIVLFVNPNAVEMSVWMGVWGCGHPISTSVWRNGIIFFAVINIAAIYASAADAITVFIVFAIVNIGPLSFGLCSFSDRNICVPALLLALDSFRNTASACAANHIAFSEEYAIIGVCCDIIYKLLNGCCCILCCCCLLGSNCTKCHYKFSIDCPSHIK